MRQLLTYQCLAAAGRRQALSFSKWNGASVLSKGPWVGCALVAPIFMSGCASQSGYVPVQLDTKAAWFTPSTAVSTSTKTEGVRIRDTWWTALEDPALDTLMPKALSDSPTLAKAVARIDEARAMLGGNSAQRLPSINADAGVERARSAESSAAGNTSSTAYAGLRLGWEPDLFGRIRQSVEAASNRLDARDADARSTRLALTTQVAHGVIELRACLFSERVQTADIESRAAVLELVRQQLSVGAAVPVEEARAISSLAAARTRSISQHEECSRQLNALTSLTGQDSSIIQQLLVGAENQGEQSLENGGFIPHAPHVTLMLPADVIEAHPNVAAAELEASAAWSEIGVARAERMPRVDLGGLLTGNWLSAGGASQTRGAWSLAASITAPLFDGGAGVAAVSAASARYRLAEAQLRQAVRLAAQDVEDALASSASAQQRQGTTQEALESARIVLRATQAQWEAGAVSLFELEDARRQLTSAEDASIAALRDSAQAWIALVQASGNTAVVHVSPKTKESVASHD